MLEQLLSGGRPRVDAVILYIDMATLTETIEGRPVVVTNGAAIDNAFLIDGKPTLRMPTGGATGPRLRINFAPAFNLSTTNWTIEWSVHYVVAPGVWTNELFFTEPTYYRGFQLRFADSGWDGMLMFADNALGNNSSARVDLRPAGLAGKLNRYAVTNKGGKIRFFINGQPTDVSPGLAVNGLPPRSEFEVQSLSNFAGLTELNMGGFSDYAVNSSRYLGNVRISNYVRYNTNYIPDVV